MELFWYNIKEMDAAAYDAALSMMDAARRARVRARSGPARNRSTGVCRPNKVSVW